MALPLTDQKLEERRQNLKTFRDKFGMDDDTELTTTLLMQEEWLATVDRLQGYLNRIFVESEGMPEEDIAQQIRAEQDHWA